MPDDNSSVTNSQPQFAFLPPRILPPTSKASSQGKYRHIGQFGLILHWLEQHWNLSTPFHTTLSQLITTKIPIVYQQYINTTNFDLIPIKSTTEKLTPLTNIEFINPTHPQELFKTYSHHWKTILPTESPINPTSYRHYFNSTKSPPEQLDSAANKTDNTPPSPWNISGITGSNTTEISVALLATLYQIDPVKAYGFPTIQDNNRIDDTTWIHHIKYIQNIIRKIRIHEKNNPKIRLCFHRTGQLARIGFTDI